MNEVDYKSRANAKGGSPLGTDKRKCPKNMKYRIWQWAVEEIAHGNESHFIHNPNSRKGRFSKKLFEPLVPILMEEFPEESAEYFGGREEKAAHLIANRLHKMYYGNDGKTRSRGISSEHPRNWK